MHLARVLFILLLCGLSAALLVLLPLAADLLANNDRLLTKLKEGKRLDGIAYLLAEDLFKTAQQFWKDSLGVEGLYLRFIAMTYLIRVMQVRVVQNPQLASRAGEFYAIATAQVAWSIASLPEALLCKAWPSMPHFCAQTASLLHVRLTTGIQNEFFGDDLRDGIGKLY